MGSTSTTLDADMPWRNDIGIGLRELLVECRVSRHIPAAIRNHFRKPPHGVSPKLQVRLARRVLCCNPAKSVDQASLRSQQISVRKLNCFFVFLNPSDNAIAHAYAGGRDGFGSQQGGYGGAARQTTCYSCGGFGHMSRDCTLGQKCYNCDESLCYFCKIRACQTEHRRLPWSGVALMQPIANSNAKYVRLLAAVCRCATRKAHGRWYERTSKFFEVQTFY